MSDGVDGHPEVPPDERVPMLEVSDLRVSFGGTDVLSGIDFDVECGSLVGLVGPNGAGKTTTLRAIRATLTPDAGTIRVAGSELADHSAKAVSRLVASTPQATTLSFDFSVETVVEMGRTPHLGRFERADSEDRAAVEAAMDRADVTQFADRQFTSLSGGERQRVLLARALAQETPVLLLDEPTASLDINHAVRTLELVRDLVADGKTVVAVIHDLNLAARYCDELLLLTDGRVRAAGDPTEVLTRETLGDSFDAETLVTTQPGTDAPLVTPLAERAPRATRVHVVGTGRQAAAAVARLVAEGVDVTVGVVPAGDTAAERARELDCEVVTVPPFAGIDQGARDRATTLAGEADTVVVAGDVGDGNQAVVEAARRLVAVEGEGVPTISSPRTTVTSVDSLSDVIDDLPRADERGADTRVQQ